MSVSGLDLEVDPLTEALMRDASAKSPSSKVLDEMEAHERGVLASKTSPAVASISTDDRSRGVIRSKSSGLTSPTVTGPSTRLPAASVAVTSSSKGSSSAVASSGGRRTAAGSSRHAPSKSVSAILHQSKSETRLASSRMSGKIKHRRIGASERSRRKRKQWLRKTVQTSMGFSHDMLFGGSMSEDDSEDEVEMIENLLSKNPSLAGVSPLTLIGDYLFEDESQRLMQHIHLSGSSSMISHAVEMDEDGAVGRRKLLWNDSHTLQMKCVFVMPALTKSEFDNRYSSDSRLLVEGKLSVTNYMLYFEPIPETTSLLSLKKALRHLTLPLAEISRINAETKKGLAFGSLCAISRRRAQESTNLDLAIARAAELKKKKRSVPKDSLALLTSGVSAASSMASSVASRATAMTVAGSGSDGPISDKRRQKDAVTAIKSTGGSSSSTVVVSQTSGDAVTIEIVTRRYRTVKFLIEEQSSDRLTQVIRMLQILCFPRELKHSFAFRYADKHPVRKIIMDYKAALKERSKRSVTVSSKSRKTVSSSKSSVKKESTIEGEISSTLDECLVPSAMKDVRTIAISDSSTESFSASGVGPKIKVVSSKKKKKLKSKADLISGSKDDSAAVKETGSDAKVSGAGSDELTTTSSEPTAAEFDAAWSSVLSDHSETEAEGDETDDGNSTGAEGGRISRVSHGTVVEREGHVTDEGSKSMGPADMTSSIISAEKKITTPMSPTMVGNYDIWGWKTYDPVAEYARIGIEVESVIDVSLDERTSVSPFFPSSSSQTATKSFSSLLGGTGGPSRSVFYRTPSPSPSPDGGRRSQSGDRLDRSQDKAAAARRAASASITAFHGRVGRRGRDAGRRPVDTGTDAINKYRLSMVNKNYSMCASYPWVVCVPSVITDSQLLQVAKFRRLGRIPVLTWKRRGPSNVALFRCSQPKVGVTSARSSADEFLIKCIVNANSDSSNMLYIMDARPKLNAQFNKFTRGAGVESADVYDNCVIEFLDIANIHVMRKARKSLASIIYKAYKYKESEWLTQLSNTDWLLHIRFILKGTLAIIRVMTGLHSNVLGKATSVLCHCSDGWDRTSQLCCLVQMCMDPFYRTLKGFIVLIEKDWLSFGHQFAQRCGFNKNDGTESDDERSPVFEQFIDCVWQLTQQFPTAFEFNGEFLIEVMNQLYSMRFGTFFCDTECQRSDRGYQLRSYTLSLWTYLQNCPMTRSFYNPFYDNSLLTKPVKSKTGAQHRTPAFPSQTSSPIGGGPSSSIHSIPDTAALASSASAASSSVPVLTDDSSHQKNDLTTDDELDEASTMPASLRSMRKAVSLTGEAVSSMSDPSAPSAVSASTSALTSSSSSTKKKKRGSKRGNPTPIPSEQSDENEGILFPNFSSKLIKFWNAYYLRHSAEHLRFRSTKNDTAIGVFDDMRQIQLEQTYKDLQMKLVSCYRQLAALKSHNRQRASSALIRSGGGGSVSGRGGSVGSLSSNSGSRPTLDSIGSDTLLGIPSAIGEETWTGDSGGDFDPTIEQVASPVGGSFDEASGGLTRQDSTLVEASFD